MRPSSAAHMPKAAQSFPLTKAFAKSAAPPAQYLKEAGEQPDKRNMVAPTATIVTRQILPSEKELKKM
ncbi:MAG: hypothetical protein KF763_21095 [Cyclobacteriaceae bacterium]|nr:hypothetical protein [Cyclobacteriaceae bacterium]